MGIPVGIHEHGAVKLNAKVVDIVGRLRNRRYLAFSYRSFIAFHSDEEPCFLFMKVKHVKSSP